MEITVKIEINEDQIQRLAQQASDQYLKVPDTWRGDSGGTGYTMIKRQVEEALAGMDFSEIAKATAARAARGIVEEVTRETIKKMAKDAVKAIKEEGSLL